MKKKTIVITIFLMLVLSTFAVSGISIIKNVKKTDIKNQSIGFSEALNDADLPTWYIGNTWIYDGSMRTPSGSSPSFDLDFRDMELKVTAINPTNYTVEVKVEEGDITGSGGATLPGIGSISGTLVDTSIYGYFYVNKADLAIDMMEVTIEGSVKALITIDFSAELKTTFYNGNTFERMMYSSLNFPMNISDTWIRDEMYILSNASVSLLPNNINLFFNVKETLFECSSWDIIDVSGIDFDALLIKRNAENNYLWYSPRAGNIIKVDYSNIDLDYGYVLEELKMNLKSTNYVVSSNPPDMPSTPSGESLVDIGTTVEYSASTTEPDGDLIRYVFIFSDGTSVTSDFLESGETATVLKSWMQKGTFDVTVKARDKYGAESASSPALSVEVLNQAPAIPEPPTGPTSGRIKRKSYTYEAYSYDPDGHLIRLEFDWDDGRTSFSDYVASNVTVSANHIWNSRGDYEIRVRAQDQYGEYSDWSDPLSVNMPKYKSIIFERFPILSKIREIFVLFSEKFS